MPISNLETVPARRIGERLGLVQGKTGRAKHVGRDLLAGVKNVVGGEFTACTEPLPEAREEATGRMLAQAAAMGARVLRNVRCSTSDMHNLPRVLRERP